MDDALRQELLAMQGEEQSLHTELSRSGEIYGEWYARRLRELNDRQGRRLAEIMAAHGWPGAALVGSDGETAAWFTVQHAIALPAVQRRALALLTAAIARGEAPKAQAAYLEDKVRMMEGEPQRYGTQFDWGDDGRLTAWTVADPTRVDALRATIGLGPLRETAERFGAVTEGRPSDLAAYRGAFEDFRTAVGWTRRPLPFDRARDALAVADLIGNARAAGGLADYWHPGGIQWWLRRIGRERFSAWVWRAGASLTAFLLEDDGYVVPQPAERTTAARLELIDWAECALRAGGRERIEVSAADGEDDLIAALRARGYADSPTFSTELVADVERSAPAISLPPEFTIATLESVTDDEHVALHRGAWSTVRPSPYDRTQHDAVTEMPDFRRDMVPIVRAPDGTPAAYCMSWIDPRSGTVEIEPLGTHPRYRRLGLASAVVHEVMRRARERGARSVMVWGSSTNDAAVAMYRGAGMTTGRIVRDYRKTL